MKIKSLNQLLGFFLMEKISPKPQKVKNKRIKSLFPIQQEKKMHIHLKHTFPGGVPNSSMKTSSGKSGCFSCFDSDICSFDN